MNYMNMMNMMNMMNNGMNFNNMNMNNMNYMNMMNMMNNMNMNNMYNNNGMNFGNMNNPNANMNNNNMPNSMNNIKIQNNNNFGVQNNNNNMSFSAGNVNTNNNGNNNQQPKELIPRSDKVWKDSSLASANNDQPRINVTFDTSTGLKVIIFVTRNITIRELIKQFIKKIGISESHIGTNIIFLFNGEKMNPFSGDTLYSFPDVSVITVVDQNNVIGA